MTSPAFDHPPDATCPCIVCGYWRSLPAGERPPGPGTPTNDVDNDAPTPAVARLRAGKFIGNTHTLSAKSLTREEREVAQTLTAPADAPARPRTRGECVGGPRPCPWVGCNYHLYLDVNERTGALRLAHPAREPWEMEQTCALDVADAGAATLETVGRLMGVTRERTRQIESKAMRRASMRSPGVRAQLDGAVGLESLGLGQSPWMAGGGE